MKAAYIEQTGPPESHQGRRICREPEPGPGQVLVRVHAVALNPIDLYIRSGMVPMPLAFPYVIGCDLAGTVEAARPGVQAVQGRRSRLGLEPGAARPPGRGGRVSRPSTRNGSIPRPRSCPTSEAAAMALVGITAHLGLFRFGQLKTGETVYVPGGSGGVGSMVVQMAKAAGARVATSAGSPERARALPQPRCRPRPQLQDRRHPGPAPRIRPRRGRRLVRNPARAQPRGLHPPAPQARPDDPDGRPHRQADAAPRGLLSPELRDPRLRHVQRHARRATGLRRATSSAGSRRASSSRSSAGSFPLADGGRGRAVPRGQHRRRARAR